MPQTLSVRDQDLVIATLRNLIDSDRIHKSDVNPLNKLLKSIDNVVISKEFMGKIAEIAKDPDTLQNIFCKLFFKLAGQDSKMLNEKNGKLKNIQDKLIPSFRQACTEEIKGEVRNLKYEIRMNSTNIYDIKNKIATIQKNNADHDHKISLLEQQQKPLWATLNKTTKEEFIEADKIREQKADTNIAALFSELKLEIEKYNHKINGLKNIHKQCIEFANKHNVTGVERDLKLAESGAIFDDNDTGFGITSWKEHISSDAYAKEKFGKVAKRGPHSYSSSTTEPNTAGKQWQKLMANINKAPIEIKAAKNEIRQLKADHQSAVREINFNSRIPKSEIITQKLATIKDDLAILNGQKNYNSNIISECQNKLSSLEATNKKLETQLSLLEAKLN